MEVDQLFVGGKTELIFINGNLNANQHRNQIVLPVFLPYLANMTPGAIFQQDNARSHVTRLIIETFKDHANSPHMSPIEKCRDIMKKRLVETRQRFSRPSQQVLKS